MRFVNLTAITNIDELENLTSSRVYHLKAAPEFYCFSKFFFFFFFSKLIQ